MPVRKRIKPSIKVSFRKTDNTITLNYAQVEAIVRRIIFDPEFLRNLKRSMQSV